MYDIIVHQIGGLFMDNIISNKFENSLKISAEYNKVLENINYYLSNPNKLKKVVEKIKKLRVLEDKDYDNLNLTQIEYYLSLIGQIDENHSRILTRLINKKELISDKDNMTSDTIDGIIHLKGAKGADSEIFKLMARDDFSESDKRACRILFSANFISLISVSSINLFAENLLIECDYDMDLLFDAIDPYKIDNISYNKKLEIIIKRINSMLAIDNREYQNVYFLLLCKEEINFLLDSTDKEILKVIKIVISTLNLNNCNMEAFNSIKRRIRQKEEELS